MAFNQEYINRYKAEGFYKHVEWNQRFGVLVKIFDPRHGKQAITFEAVRLDHEYDQTIPDGRQFFLFRKEAAAFMVNMGLPTEEIVSAFRRIDGVQVVSFHVESKEEYVGQRSLSARSQEQDSGRKVDRDWRKVSRKVGA